MNPPPLELVFVPVTAQWDIYRDGRHIIRSARAGMTAVEAARWAADRLGINGLVWTSADGDPRRWTADPGEEAS